MPLLNDADAIYRGATTVDRVYRGATLVWEPAASGPLVSDTFDRPDNSTSLGTADTGQTWNHQADQWAIDSNQAKKRVASGGAAIDSPASIESGVSDAVVTCDIRHDGNNGVLFRFVDASHYMMARLGANKVELYRRNANFTLVAQAAMTLTSGQTYAFKVTVSGSTIDVDVDGVNKITATDSFQSTATKHGMYAVAGTNRHDNFTVDAL